MSEITGGELLLRSLHAEGARDIWAIPDGTYMIFLEALERLGPELGMRLFVPGHEAAAAHAADAMTRITGKPAVVMACAGPGAANLISGVLCAQDEGSPVVAITTTRRSDIAYPHMGAMQVLDQHAYFTPATKWSAHIGQWKRIPDAVRHAFRVAMAGRPGPVHIEFPEDLLLQKGDPDQAPFWQHSENGQAGSAAHPALVQRAATMLLDATLPLIHAGGGTQRSGAGSEAQALAEYLGCPVTTGAGSRGVVPDGHPLVLQPVSPASAVAKNMADVVLAVGTRFGELDFWGRPPVWREAAQQKVIQIDADPQNIGLNRPAGLALAGDAKAVLAQILDAVREMSPARETYSQIAVVRDVDEKWRQQMDERVADTSRRPMVPGQIFTQANEFFPPDTIFALDGGNTCVWAAHYLKVRAPRSMLWTSN
ncbi:MAG: thiamine pyrophosphate-binding protein, partial [Chloroflexota bacterium]